MFDPTFDARSDRNGIDDPFDRPDHTDLDHTDRDHTDPDHPDLDHTDEDAVRSNDADLGEPSWIEVGDGFPPGGVARGELAWVGRDEIIVQTTAGNFTGEHAANVVAFTEFLAGTAFPAGEREWLVDAMAREFAESPGPALEQMDPIGTAVESMPDHDPLSRADNRLKALTAMYRTEPIRERLDLPETPVITMLKAHNPPLLVDHTGVVVVQDAITARHEINELVLRLAGRSMADNPGMKAELATTYLDAAAPMKAELAGSQIRLVTLRTWLSLLPQHEMDQLQARLTDVIDTATDLDMVALQLSFRSTIEAMVA